MRSVGSSVNDICFNKIKLLKLLPSCKSVNLIQRSYLNTLMYGKVAQRLTFWAVNHDYMGSSPA